MSCHLYGGVPIEQVDFEAEFDKEIEILTGHINKLKAIKRMKRIKNFQYWTIKLNRANKALETGQVTLD